MTEQENMEWKERYDSLAQAVVSLEAENNRLLETNKLLIMEKVQWEVSKGSQEAIVQQSLDKSNATSNENLEEIVRLRAIIKELRGE